MLLYQNNDDIWCIIDIENCANDKVNGCYMKIGLLYLKEIKYDDLAYVFVKKEIDSEIIDTGISVDSTDEADTLKVADLLAANGIDVAITMDFCPAVSDACQRYGIKYVSWIYDNPQQALYNRQIPNSNNYIFSFDRDQVGEIESLGAKNVFHLPLATNVLRNAGLVISERDEYRYGCDVSFIGNMYVDGYYEKVRSLTSEKTAKEMDQITREAFGIWDGSDHMGGRLSEDTVMELARICGYAQKDEFSMPVENWLCARLFARRLAHLERVELAQRLQFTDFRLYTSSKDFELEGIDIWPELSYDEELPRANHLSKININCTLHSITSGIPLRVFDIMGVGGFVLSNYQPEIEELFTIGKDIEVYRNFDELEDKVRFYLTHDDQRAAIALRGYQNVSEKYNYEVALEKIIALT